jgi:hypothetical protein
MPNIIWDGEMPASLGDSEKRYLAAATVVELCAEEYPVAIAQARRRGTDPLRLHLTSELHLSPAECSMLYVSLAMHIDLEPCEVTHGEIRKGNWTLTCLYQWLWYEVNICRYGYNQRRWVPCPPV